MLGHESIDRTIVWMRLNNHTSRTSKKIFDQHTTGEGYRFDKTIVPVRLAQYGDEQLMSRSQAKRLVARVEKFKIVILDFNGVDMIGQAFADEVFRVFAKRHTGVNLKYINANAEVMKLIERVTSTDIEKT
ncbi:MAG: STAS-like domain-containing protein [Acidiferrobacter sp.]